MCDTHQAPALGRNNCERSEFKGIGRGPVTQWIILFIAVHCPELAESEGLKLSNPSTKMNSVVVFTCRSGMRLIGSDETTCLPSGHWSHDVPSCESKNTSKLLFFERKKTSSHFV